MTDPALQNLFNSIVDGKATQAKEQTQAAIAGGLSPQIILQEGMIAAMSKVGELFASGEYYVPEMLVAARAMKEGLSVLKPRLVSSDFRAVGRAVFGTVSGDLHDIGKNLVCMMLEGAGFEIVDLGTDISPTRFVDAVRTQHPDLLGMSALLTTTMPSMKATIELLIAEGLRDRVKVLIGGAPVTAEYAKLIGADGFAPDASRAAELAKAMLARSA